MIPALLIGSVLAAVALAVVDAARVPATLTPERGQVWLTEVGARARVLGVGRSVLLEIEDLEIAGLWGIHRVASEEWAWVAERWEYAGDDPDLLIPPSADGGVA